MPVPVVAIHLEFPVEPPSVQRLLDACSSGARRSACVLAEDPGANAASYLAYVSWLDDAQQHALVEVGPPDAVRGSFEFRRLRFSASDQPSERWEAIGLTVATLVGSEAPAPVTDDEVTTPWQPTDEVAVRSWRAGVAARLGSGFSTGVSAGLGLSFAYELPGLPLFPLVFGGWRTATEQGITGHWWEAGVGLGVKVGLGPVRLALSGLVVGQLLTVSANQDGGTDSGDSSTSGVAGELEFAWPREGPVGVTLGGQVLQIARATEISSEGQVVLETPRTNYGASLGLESRF